MTKRDKENVSLWDPVVFDGAFPSRASLCNIDGFIEISNHFLFVEHKYPGEGYRQSRSGFEAQKVALSRLGKILPQAITVVELRGNDGTEGLFSLRDMGTGKIILADSPFDEVYECMQRWGKQSRQKVV